MGETKWRSEPTDVEESADEQLTGHLGVKHCFGAGRESGTKSRQTLNTRYDLKITGVKVGQ